MAAVVGALAELARETKCAINLIHHQGGDPNKWFRGGTAIADQADALFGFLKVKDPAAPQGEDDEDEDNDTGTRRLSCRGNWGKPHRAAAAPKDRYMQIVGGDGTEAALELVPAAKPLADKRVHYMGLIPTVLPLKTKTDAAKACGTTRTNGTWRDAWDALAANNTIVELDGLWTAMPADPEPPTPKSVPAI
jgi:hypothetical protein